jgi:exopolyphosphatase/pppGpp-phosphohydrolase
MNVNKKMIPVETIPGNREGRYIVITCVNTTMYPDLIQQ